MSKARNISQGLQGCWAASAIARNLPVTLAVLLSGCGVASETSDTRDSPTASSAQALTSAARRPAGVPSDYVVTPNGWRHPSCVIQMAADETLGDDHIRRADGTKRAFAQCQHEAYDPTGNVLAEATRAPQDNGWVASVSSTSAGPINYLAATWPVPKTPALPASQTLFFFPGIEPSATGDVILQPVLAWNGFSDSAWTIASWACCKNGNVFYSGPQGVSAGDSLTGTITGSSCNSSGVCANWNILTKDNRTGKSTTFPTIGGGEKMDWVFGGAMEVYGVDTCSELPAITSFRFSDIVTRTTAGKYVLPQFSPWSAGSTVSPNCNETLGSPRNSGTATSWLLSWTNSP